MNNDQQLALVTGNESNALVYHQLPGATQSQFIISLDPQISQV